MTQRAGNIGAELTLLEAHTVLLNAQTVLLNTNNGLLDELILEHSHLTKIFPEDSDETITLTAHATPDTFSAWAEIVDNNSVTLSSRFAAAGGHISGILAESDSVKDKIFIFEISYGASNIVVATGRLMSGTVQLTLKQQQRMSSVAIPAGETIYYRIKCETGGANITVSFRYHID